MQTENPRSLGPSPVSLEDFKRKDEQSWLSYSTKIRSEILRKKETKAGMLTEKREIGTNILKEKIFSTLNQKNNPIISLQRKLPQESQPKKASSYFMKSQFQSAQTADPYPVKGEHSYALATVPSYLKEPNTNPPNEGGYGGSPIYPRTNYNHQKVQPILNTKPQNYASPVLLKQSASNSSDYQTKNPQSKKPIQAQRQQQYVSISNLRERVVVNQAPNPANSTFYQNPNASNPLFGVYQPITSELKDPNVNPASFTTSRKIEGSVSQTDLLAMTRNPSTHSFIDSHNTRGYSQVYPMPSNGRGDYQQSQGLLYQESQKVTPEKMPVSFQLEQGPYKNQSRAPSPFSMESFQRHTSPEKDRADYSIKYFPQAHLNSMDLPNSGYTSGEFRNRTPSPFRNNQSSNISTYAIAPSPSTNTPIFSHRPSAVLGNNLN